MTNLTRVLTTSGWLQRARIATILVLALLLTTLAFRRVELHVSAASQTSAREHLIGTWKLVSRESRLDNGEMVPDPTLGDKPSGVLIYDATGHVAAQLSRQGRTMDIFKDECAAITALKTSPNTANTVFGYDAYFGSYTLHEKDGYVTHHLESALWPGNQGKDINRFFTLQGDVLTIKFATTQDGKAVTRTLVWNRWK